jgi:hypothetical protein
MNYVIFCIVTFCFSNHSKSSTFLKNLEVLFYLKCLYIYIR